MKSLPQNTATVARPGRLGTRLLGLSIVCNSLLLVNTFIIPAYSIYFG